MRYRAWMLGVLGILGTSGCVSVRPAPTPSMRAPAPPESPALDVTGARDRIEAARTQAHQTATAHATRAAVAAATHQRSLVLRRTRTDVGVAWRFADLVETADTPAKVRDLLEDVAGRW